MPKSFSKLLFEHLEIRRLLAIDWVNRGAVGNDSDNFENLYGLQDAVVARQIVDHAINDWNAVIQDQDFDNDNNPLTNDFQLNVAAFDFATIGSLTTRGDTGNFNLTTGGAGQAGWTVGVPRAARIRMDDNGGGAGWFFDSTPLDDIEFTSIANSFQATFVDATTAGQTRQNDFYRTIVHEIGHALGIFLASGQRLFNMTTDVGDDPNSTNPSDRLRQFNSTTGPIVITTNGGGHIFEGNHPNDLMNAGRTVPPAGADPIPTTRQFISDLNVQLLADAYGYDVTLAA